MKINIVIIVIMAMAVLPSALMELPEWVETLSVWVFAACIKNYEN